MNKNNSKQYEYEQQLFNKIIKNWIYPYTISNKNLKTLKKYCEENLLIKTFDEVVEENIRYWKIKCPIEFLNTKIIVENDYDYIKYGIYYLNINHLKEELFNGDLKYMIEKEN